MQSAHSPPGDKRFDELERLRRRIAELEQTEREHRQTAELHRRIMQTMGCAVAHVNEHGELLTANVEAQRILGLSEKTPTSYRARDFERIAIRDDGNLLAENEYPVTRCLRTGQPQPPATLGFRQGDGHILWANLTAAPLIDPSTGKTDGAVVTLSDVTEHQRAEEALRAGEERYRRLAESVKLIAWEYDPESKRFLFVSDNAREILGYPIEDWRERAFWYNHIHPQDREHAASFSRQHVARRVNHDFEYRMIRADGGIAWIRDITTIVTRPDNTLALHGVFIDITDRKRADAALRESEQRHRAFIEQSTEGIWCFELEEPISIHRAADQQIEHFYRTTVLSECNDAMAQMYGFTRANELVGARLGDLMVQSDPHNVEYLKSFVRSKYRLTDAESHEVDKAGNEKFFLNNMVGIIEDGMLVRVWGTQRDITARKRAEDALRESTDLTRMMLSELDHRVRNNLAALAALIDISMRDKTDVREFAESIRGRVQAMSAVHSLLSRAHWQAVSLRSLIDTLTPTGLHGAVIANGLDLLITPRQVTALGMILQELMANSLKYGALRNPDGRIKLHWTLGDMPDRQGRRLKFIWHETDGPIIERAPQPGQGTGLILGFVRSELRGTVELTYPATGALHTFILNLDRVEEKTA